MIEAVALSFLIGQLRRGTMRSLASLDLKGTEWIFFGAVIIKIGRVLFLDVHNTAN